MLLRPLKTLILAALAACLLSPLKAEIPIPQGLTLSAKLELKGLWALHASADGASMTTGDVKALFAPGALTLNDTAPVFGFSIRVQRHLNNRYYLGAGLDQLTKSFSLRDAAINVTNIYEWVGLFPNALAGYTFYRGTSSFINAEAQLGSMILSQSTWSQDGGSQGGTFKGSAFAWVFSLNTTWFMMPSVGLHAALGWRQALISNVAFNDDLGKAIVSPSRETPRVDFSGPQARLGISFYWGMKNPWGNMYPAPAAPKIKPPSTEN